MGGFVITTLEALAGELEGTLPFCEAVQEISAVAKATAARIRAVPIIMFFPTTPMAAPSNPHTPPMQNS
jgi:hypothetical protein